MKNQTILNKWSGLRRALLVLAIAGAAVGTVRAERYQLPTTQEIAPFSRESVIFYNAGVNSLDRSDYLNAYTNLTKAAQLEPQAVQLNLLVAGLATRLGRDKKADEATEYYDTAKACLENILALPNLEDKFRRQIYNRLKIATREQTELSQRDVKREAEGGKFIAELNKTYTADMTPEPTKNTVKPASPEVIRALTATPTPQPGQPGQQGQQGQPGQQPGAEPGAVPAGGDPAMSAGGDRPPMI